MQDVDSVMRPHVEKIRKYRVKIRVANVMSTVLMSTGSDTHFVSFELISAVVGAVPPMILFTYLVSQLNEEYKKLHKALYGLLTNVNEKLFSQRGVEVVVSQEELRRPVWNSIKYFLIYLEHPIHILRLTSSWAHHQENWNHEARLINIHCIHIVKKPNYIKL